MISKFIKKQLESHKAKFDGAGNSSLYYKVKSERSGKIYDQSIKLNCTCEYFSNQGVKQGKLCSHLRKVLLEMVESDRLDLTED